jgi:glycosyltransferase involved in cell wall biosynthesis
MLDKLLETDYPNLEVIVLDGASNDNTINVLKSYGNKITGWVSEKDGGEYDALNKGISIATGEIIKHMTDDDIIQPEAFRVVGAFFAAHPDVGIVFTQVRWWEEKDGKAILLDTSNYTDPTVLKPRAFIRSMRNKPGPPTLGGFVRRWVFEKIGVFSTDFIIGDYEFWARAVSMEIPIALMPDILSDYYYTGENAVTLKTRQIVIDMINIARKYGTANDVAYYIRILLKRDFMRLAAVPFHAMGIHPLRWLERMSSREMKEKNLR